MSPFKHRKVDSKINRSTLAFEDSGIFFEKFVYKPKGSNVYMLKHKPVCGPPPVRINESPYIKFDVNFEDGLVIIKELPEDFNHKSLTISYNRIKVL